MLSKLYHKTRGSLGFTQIMLTLTKTQKHYSTFNAFIGCNRAAYRAGMNPETMVNTTWMTKTKTT